MKKVTTQQRNTMRDLLESFGTAIPTWVPEILNILILLQFQCLIEILWHKLTLMESGTGNKNKNEL